MAILAHNEFGILRLTITRPEKRNALNAQMFDTLTEAFADAARDDAVRVVLIRGEDRLFSAGADLEEMQTAPEELERAMAAFFSELRSFPKPIVAKVSGPCVGEAFIMLLYCDLVYVSGEALFSLPAVALARTPRFGSAAIIEAAAGLPKAAEKLLLSEPISAEEAAAMRLVTTVIEPENLEQVVAVKT
ncbi:MAG: enoyl-CoA hydratase-related protein, partial [Sutterella sp.]